MNGGEGEKERLFCVGRFDIMQVIFICQVRTG